jgi:hypothetical protein
MVIIPDITDVVMQQNLMLHHHIANGQLEMNY